MPSRYLLLSVLALGLATAALGAVTAVAQSTAQVGAPTGTYTYPGPGTVNTHWIETPNGANRQLVEHAGAPDVIAAAVLALLANPTITNSVLDVDGGERLCDWSGDARRHWIWSPAISCAQSTTRSLVKLR